MKLHVLKIENNYYSAVMEGRKRAEFRKDDRDFKEGDLIHFTNTLGNEYEGQFNLFIITHILPCRNIFEDNKDYVVLSLQVYNQSDLRRY